MEIIKRMILDDSFIKEFESLGFKLKSFHLDNNELKMIFSTRANKTIKSEALLFLNVDYLFKKMIYQTRIDCGFKSEKDFKKYLTSLKSELKNFEHYHISKFWKNGKDLNQAKKDLLELARAYNKIFLNGNLNGGLTA